MHLGYQWSVLTLVYFSNLCVDIQVALEYLSPIQPQWILANVRFIADDCEEEWLANSYDLVHFCCVAAGGSPEGCLESSDTHSGRPHFRLSTT